MNPYYQTYQELVLLTEINILIVSFQPGAHYPTNRMVVGAIVVSPGH